MYTLFRTGRFSFKEYCNHVNYKGAKYFFLIYNNSDWIKEAVKIPVALRGHRLNAISPAGVLFQTNDIK